MIGRFIRGLERQGKTNDSPIRSGLLTALYLGKGVMGEGPMSLEFSRAGYLPYTVNAYYVHEFKCSARHRIIVFVLMWAFCLLFSVRRKTFWRVYPKIKLGRIYPKVELDPHLDFDWVRAAHQTYIGYARFSTTKGRGWIKHKPASASKTHAGKESAHLPTLDEVIKAKLEDGDFAPITLREGVTTPETDTVLLEWKKIDSSGAKHLTDLQLLELVASCYVKNGWGLLAELCKRFSKRVDAP